MDRIRGGWEIPAIADDDRIRHGRGIVVAGCPACKKRLQSMNEFLRHLAEDAMPRLLDRLPKQ